MKICPLYKDNVFLPLFVSVAALFIVCRPSPLSETTRTPAEGEVFQVLIVLDVLSVLLKIQPQKEVEYLLRLFRQISNKIVCSVYISCSKITRPTQLAKFSKVIIVLDVLSVLFKIQPQKEVEDFPRLIRKFQKSPCA